MAVVENVGGGTWNHDVSYSFPTTKKVWSNYVHPTLRHSATSICGSNNVKRWADPTVWANTNTQCAVNQSSAVYWGLG